MSNRYPGICHACKANVPVNTGKLEYVGRWYNGQRTKSNYLLWCLACFNKSDCSGDEDRCCGNRAYEDQCARQCGMDNY